MRNKRRLRALFNKVYVLCLIIALVGCIPATPTPTPPTDTPTPSATATDTPTPTPTPTPIPPSPICETPAEPETQELTNGYFSRQQMMVIGPEPQVKLVIDEVAPDAVLLQDCHLSFLSTFSFNTENPPPLEGKVSVDWFFETPGLNPQEQRTDLTMRLYEFREEVQIEQRISEVNEAGNPSRVFADPNYLTGVLEDGEPCYLPTSGGGGGGGKPYGGYGIPDPVVTPPIEDQFMEQWALNGQGIALPNTLEYKGSGIRVGIFDTAPLELLALDPFPAQPSDLAFASIKDAVTGPEPTLGAGDLDGSDHGLLVAGLIHRLAEGSEIHLIRVLNDKGCGKAFDLARAIFEFINEMATTSETQNLQNVVMNFSLGMSKPVENPDNQDIQWNKLKVDFVAFETAIFEARRLGAFIFGAAGNESTHTSVKEMVLPAAYDKIYGVAAVNPDSDRSCFSNKGDIAAPGGDGGQGVEPGNSESCTPRSETWQVLPPPPQCPDMERCRYGLISLSLRATGGPGYIFWAGTSFATPLAAGLGVLTLEKAGGDLIEAECLMRAGIMPTADPNLGMGRINVARSLASTSCP